MTSNTTTQPASQTIQNQLKPIRDILIEMDLVHQQIEVAMQAKKNAIIAADVNELMNQDHALLALAQQLERLEIQRRNLVTQLGIDAETIDSLCNVLGPEATQYFSDIRQRLSHRLRDIRILNQETDALLNLSIHWVRDTIRVITDACVPEAASYDAKGQSAKPSGYASKPSATTAAFSTIQHNA